jgi:hypothetical protein
MPDEETTETVEQEKQVETTEEVEQEEEFDKERAMATIRKLREFEKQASRLEKENEALKKAEADRKKAEMSEMDRLQAERDEAQTELERLKLNEQKRSIAREVGLPDELALRIRGETVEEMKADAEMLKEVIPEPAEPGKKPKINPTNPGTTPSQAETDEQRRKRLGLG